MYEGMSSSFSPHPLHGAVASADLKLMMNLAKGYGDFVKVSHLLIEPVRVGAVYDVWCVYKL